MALHIGQGDVFRAPRAVDGSIKELIPVGEAPVFEVMIQTENTKDYETSSGLRTQILHVRNKQTAEVTITLKDATSDNLAFLTNGTRRDQIAQTLTAEPMPSGLVAGKVYRLPKDVTNVTGATFVDSAGTPAALTEGTHYDLDEVFGTIVFTTSGITSKTQPFKVTTTGSGTEEQVSMMDDITSAKGQTLILHNVNTADDFAPEIWELYNVVLDATDKLPGKGDTAAEFSMKGSAILDKKKPKGGKFGQFGRIRLLKAV